MSTNPLRDVLRAYGGTRCPTCSAAPGHRHRKACPRSAENVSGATHQSCPKCSSPGIAVRYHAAIGMCSCFHVGKDQDEHLHYTCDRCHYDWSEPTDDANE